MAHLRMHLTPEQIWVTDEVSLRSLRWLRMTEFSSLRELRSFLRKKVVDAWQENDARALGSVTFVPVTLSEALVWALACPNVETDSLDVVHLVADDELSDFLNEEGFGPC
jgi:hypothetical protein